MGLASAIGPIWDNFEKSGISIRGGAPSPILLQVRVRESSRHTPTVSRRSDGHHCWVEVDGNEQTSE